MKQKATSVRESILLEFLIVFISIQLVGMPCYTCLVGYDFSTILLLHIQCSII